MSDPRPARRQFLGTTALFAGAASAAMAGQHPPADSHAPRLPREVWIATVSQAHLRAGSPKQMVDRMLEVMEQAASCQPDIVCLPETFPVANVSGPVAPLARRAAEDAPRIVERMGTFATAHRCYVICPIHFSDGERITNSAVLIDRTGKVVGRYDKAHPTVDEIESGITPGPIDPPVFETDFGRIGMQICFDIEWQDTWSHLSREGAEIVFWPSAFGGGSLINMMAAMHKYVVVSSTRKGASKVCDLGGIDLARTSLWHDWVAAPVNLEKVVLATWPFVRRFPDIYARYGQQVRITTFEEEEWSILESRSPDIRVADILEQFELKTWAEHIAEADRRQRQTRPA